DRVVSVDTTRPSARLNSSSVPSAPMASNAFSSSFTPAQEKPARWPERRPPGGPLQTDGGPSYPHPRDRPMSIRHQSGPLPGVGIGAGDAVGQVTCSSLQRVLFICSSLMLHRLRQQLPQPPLGAGEVDISQLSSFQPPATPQPALGA